MIHFNSESVRMHGLKNTFQSCRGFFTRYSLLMILCILFACDKQEIIQNTEHSPSSLKRLQMRSLSSVGDRIYFADFEGFIDYYDELDSLYVLNLDVFDSIILADSPVQTINDLYSASIDYETFLADPIMRGILNPDYEFQIGDAIISYVNNEEVLVFDEDNSTAKTAIRSLARGKPIDIEEIPAGAYWGKPDKLDDAIKIGCGCNIYIRPWTDCENVRVWGRCNSLWGNDGDGLLTVEFDDFPLGTGIQVLLEDVSGNFEFFINTTASLLYQNDGIFDGWVDPECVLAENSSAEYIFDPAIFAACDLDHQTLDDIITDGDERMKISTSFWRNNHGYSCHKAEIRSESRDDEESPWETSKARLNVEVNANLRSITCNFVDDKEDDASCTECRGRATVVRWSTRDVSHCTDDLIGDYNKVRNSTTLSEIHSVPFQCCGG